MTIFSRRVWKVVFSIVLAGSIAAPSRAWRGGWRGPRGGLYVRPWPWWYDTDYGAQSYSYYATPYPAYDAPYVLERVAPAREADLSPDNSRHDLRYLKKQIDIARGQIDFALEDGDVSAAQHDSQMHRLGEIEEEAHSEARINGSTITGDQQKELLRQIGEGEISEPTPPQSRPSIHNSDVALRTVIDRVTFLRGLLDRKREGGDITRAQHVGMSAYLARIEKQVRSDALAGGGALTRDQELAILGQLKRAEDSITRNLIVNP